MSLRKRPSAACLALAASLFFAPAHADQTDVAVLEEVLVSASYRPTALRDIPGSVSVLGDDVIRGRAARHLEDVLRTVPNLSWSAGSSRSRFVQVRGVGDLEQYYDPKYYPSVGLMLDRLELGDSANAGMLFDIAQVEVLRGPQGTRFGSSAHAGMIKLRSNEPTEDFQGEISGGIGDYDAYHLGLVASGPLSQRLGARIAVQQNSGDGFIENQVLDIDDSNDYDEFSARAKLRFDASDSAAYGFTAFYFDADNGYDTWSIDNNRNTFSDQPGQDLQETLAVTATADWTLDNALSVEAVVSHIDTELAQSYDADWVADSVCPPDACSGGNDTAREIFGRDRQRNIADLRLLGGEELSTAGDSRYVVGVYANDSEEDFDYRFPSVWYGDFMADSDYQTRRLALYGEYEYALNGDLSLLAGARLERFEDDYDNSNGFASDISDDLWNAQLSLRYALSDVTSLYATLARGAKPGGVNTSASANQPFMSPVFQAYIDDNLTFGDETLVNAEIGLRTRQLDGALQLSAALFHTERDNAQLENWMWDGDAGLWIGYLDSSSDATSYGLELEAVLLVAERIELFANLGWLQTEVDSIETFDLDLNDFVVKENREQAKSPEYQYNAGVRVAFTAQLAGQLEFEGQDATFFGYYHDGELDAYDLLNASLSWTAADVAVTLWGRNLGDEDYAVHGLYFGVDPRDDVGAWSNQTYRQLGEPRTWGVDVRYSF
ncbi:MAG: TonB-dependent receptor [Halioglobus sp.]|nr:TonB-dependent receptor [Halioglobus sp.]